MGHDRGATRMGGLDLVRALAVVAVLLYHADDLLTGGLLGVTVFFTMSGFLITGQVWRELDSTGRLDVSGFWSRRIRRLVPPSVVTVAVVAALWPLLGYHLPSADVVGSLLPIRNWVMLASHTAYGASPSPTAHFWSLAVEEQIYLVLPLAVWAGYRWLGRRPVVALLGIVAAASMAWAATLALAGELDRAYLSTATRAGEVVAGAALAVALSSRRLTGRGWAVVAAPALVGLGALFVLVAWPSEAVSTWAIPATVVATLVLCAASAVPGSWLGRAGSFAPVRAVADRAYELYLVHVPVFALLTTYRTGWSGPLLLAVRLLVTAAAATALHAAAEPVRRRRWLPSPTRLAVVVVPVMLLVGGLVVVGDHHSSVAAASASPGGSDGPLPPVVTAVAVAAPVPAAPPRSVRNRPADASEVAAPTTAPAAPAAPAPDSLWLVGDSTLRELDDPAMTAPNLSASLTTAGWDVTGLIGVRALAICGERPWDDADDDQPPTVLPPARDSIASWMAATPARTVVVQLGSNDLTQFRFSDDELRSCLEATLAALSGTEVFWVLPTFGPWCWCDVDRAHHDAVRFADLLTDLESTHPQLHLVLDGLTVDEQDPRDVFAEDGVHASREGRARRVAAIVDQLGAPPG